MPIRESIKDALTDQDLIDYLRKAASTWFKNSDLLLLEELIRRYKWSKAHADSRPTPVQ